MKRRQSMTWRHASIAALVVGLGVVSPWRGVGAASLTAAVGGGATARAQRAGGGALLALGAALELTLERGASGRALLGHPQATTPLSGTTWSQQAEITATDGAARDELGFSVALSGSTALVGAPGKNGGVTNGIGAAYVFVRSGTTWTQQATLTASDGAVRDFFGGSVAVSGNTALVGAPFKNRSTGAAYVFVRSGTTWTQQAELTAASRVAFGFSVALSGNTALVGASGKNLGTGAAYVFVRSGTTWSQQAELTASDGAQGDQFGDSVALSGTTALVGAPHKNVYTGAAYVFVHTSTTWAQQAELTAGDGVANDQFGYSVALSGSTALVAARGKNSNTGAAYVFVRRGTTWTQQATLTATDGAPNDFFGQSVALSGNTAVIGASVKNNSTGAAYVFVRSGSTWTQQAEITATDSAARDVFGQSVALSGSTALVGAWGKNSNTGAAYVFVRS